MAGASTPEMAMAAANAGAMGSLGCAFHSPEEMKADTSAAKRATNRAINVNFFVHTPPKHDEERQKEALARLQPWYDHLELGQAVEPRETHPTFGEAMCDAVIEVAPRVVSFHFGLPDLTLIKKLKDRGIVILSSATSSAEARWLEERGVDAVIAQGYEAGGHNGWFLPRHGADVAGSFALIPRIVDAVTVPVIAAGGIADGRGIVAALALGASAVQVGTAFLATPECKSSDVHKRAVLNASGDDTMHSTAFSGRAARTVVNDYARDMAKHREWPDFPMMNVATGPLRAATAKDGTGDAIALWSGQAAGLVRSETTSEVIDRLVRETQEVLSGR